MDSSNVATVSLTVQQVQVAPVCSNATVTGLENTPLVLQWSNFAISNPSDPNGALTVNITALPAVGQLQSLVNGQWVAVAVGAQFTEASINAGNLRFVPAQYGSGGPGYTATGTGDMHQVYAAFGYTATDGSFTSNAALVNIDITPVAVAPTLTLGTASNTQQLFDSGFEDAPNPTSSLLPVFDTASALDGWSVVTNSQQACGQQNGFETWTAGDKLTTASGTTIAANAATGDGSKFIELDNAGKGSGQTLGITRQINTVAGDTYALSFDLAGVAGFNASTTSVAVMVNGTVIASYDPTSTSSTLNWQHANVSFVGSGGAQTISIVTTAATHSSGGGTMLDNVALNQIQPLDMGNQGTTIGLESVNAALVDTTGDETLQVILAGMPTGTTLTDGTHTATTTAAAPTVNITGWNTSTLSITPPASYSGTLTLQVTATAAELVGGSTASVSQNLTVQVNAIAQVPTLTLNPPTTSVSQTVISTSWPTVCNTGCGPTIVNCNQFGGWKVMPAACGKNVAFEVWANGDQAKNAQGTTETLEDASGAGQEWLGLSNGVSSSYQSPGVEQTINTVANATYTFSLDYAGQLGLASANTAIGVYLDGTLVGTYSNASVNSLNWQSLSYSFKGDGNSHTLSVQLINGTNTSTARGAMINAMTLIETEPESASTVYGFAGSPIALPQISDQLAAGDPGLLETTLVGLPVGATITDGKNTATITSATTPLIVTGWNLAKLTVTVPQSQSQGGCGGSSSNTLNLQVVATSVEPTNGSMASIAKDVTVQLLSGQPVATPAGVNPYVSYVNSASLTQTLKATTNPIVIASALVPVSGSYAVTLPITSPVNSGTLGAEDDLDASLESLLESLSQSVGTALWNELGA